MSLPDSPKVKLIIEPDALRPLVQEVVAQVVAQLDQTRSKTGDRLAFAEGEAARLLGLAPHQLRDERLRGRIRASVGPGRRILYSLQDLTDYLLARRWQKS
jgi:hypothetical protein